MDSIKEIAISQIASVLSGSGMIIPRIDAWREIFNNAGLSEVYDENKCNLQCREVPGTWGQEYNHNPRCYYALHEILLNTSSNDFDTFIKLMNSIAYEININIIFDDKNVKYRDIERVIEKNNATVSNNLLLKHPSKDFKKLRNNLNILGLDFSFDKEYGENLIILPFEFINKMENKTVLIQWLGDNYPNILDAYEKAIKAYGNGDSEGTMAHCRNVITGIFSYSKRDNTKWLTGLQATCSKDKNLTDIERPNKIPDMKYVKKGDVPDEEYAQISAERKYNYPRFRLIHQVYSYLSDLGPHVAEAPLVDGTPDYEVVEPCDAFMGLRMTEDILIWLYQCEQNSL